MARTVVMTEGIPWKRILEFSMPLFFGSISSVTNVALDYAIIAWLHMGVAGAAWATVVSQAVACGVRFLYMQRKYEIFHFRGKGLKVTFSD